jgi:hypothetical protein
VITTVDDLESVLGLDFATACRELAEARTQQRTKDSPGHRAAVTEARDRVDAVLDLYLATGGLRR